MRNQQIAAQFKDKRPSQVEVGALPIADRQRTENKEPT